MAGYNQIGGVRKTTDFIEKTTWGLAVAMVVISIACAYVVPQATGNISVMEGVENPTTNPNNLPGFGTSKTNTAAPATNGSQKTAPTANKAQTTNPENAK